METHAFKYKIRLFLGCIMEMNLALRSRGFLINLKLEEFYDVSSHLLWTVKWSSRNLFHLIVGVIFMCEILCSIATTVTLFFKKDFLLVGTIVDLFSHLVP